MVRRRLRRLNRVGPFSQRESPVALIGKSVTLTFGEKKVVAPCEAAVHTVCGASYYDTTTY